MSALSLPTITVTREAKAIASVVAIVAGAGIGVFLSANPGTSRREKVLSAFLGATATLGATHTIINVLTDED